MEAGGEILDGAALAAHVEKRARTQADRTPHTLASRNVCTALRVTYPAKLLDDGVFELQPVDYLLHRVVGLRPPLKEQRKGGWNTCERRGRPGSA